MVLCGCGCGGKVKSGNRYINGHNSRCMSSETKRKISKAAKNRIYSEETKKNMSEAAKRKVFSKEHKRKISEAKKGNQCALGYKHSKESLKRMSKSQKGNQNSKGHKCSEKSKRKIGDANKGKLLGRKYTEEHRRKISVANRGNIPSPRSGYGKKSYYNNIYQGKICFRSSYEKAYAEFLDANNIDWLYEPMTFNLNNTTYLPDFYLIKEKKFVEIKGYMSEKAQSKIDAFRRMYPEEKLEVLFKEELIEMGVL